MTLNAVHHRRVRGYSLIEVTVAICILLAGVAAAAALSLSSAQMDEINQRKARALAAGEAAARLWQLGLSEGTIKSILPDVTPVASTDPHSGMVQLSFNYETATYGEDESTPASDLGSLPQASITISSRVRDASSTSSQTVSAVYHEFPPLVVIRR